MIEARGRVRVPPAARWAGLPFDPSQVSIPDRRPWRTLPGWGPRRVRGPAHPRGVADETVLPAQSDRRRRLARRQLRPSRSTSPTNNVVTSTVSICQRQAHLFMQATGVYVMNFLPKTGRGACPGTERTPVITAMSTTTRSRSSTAARSTASRCRPPYPPMRHKGFTMARRKRHANAPAASFDEHSRVDWQVIAVDTRRRLTPSAEVLAHDLGQH